MNGSGWGAGGWCPPDDGRSGRHQHRRPQPPWQDWVGGWDSHAGRGRPGGGPPPWLAGLFGQVTGQPQPNRGPRVRRGDVRAAILDVLRAGDTREEPVNGYQVIQQIAERTGQEWRPSPGSVYPTIQQLEDEGLVGSDDERGRRSLRLTDAGREYVASHADELAGVWAPFERDQRAAGRDQSGWPDLKSEIGQVMSAVWQIITAGSDLQRRAAADELVDTRRRLYRILAEGDEALDEAPEEPEGPEGPQEGQGTRGESSW